MCKKFDLKVDSIAKLVYTYVLERTECAICLFNIVQAKTSGANM